MMLQLLAFKKSAPRLCANRFQQTNNSYKKQRQISGILFVLLAFASSSMLDVESKLRTDTSKEAKYQIDPALNEFLKSFDNLSAEEKKRRMRQFLASSKAQGKTKEKAAYVLARLLKKGGSTEELKAALPLFEEAANFDLLESRANWHFVNCANTLGDETTIQHKLSQMLKSSKDSEEKAHIQYALSQSLLRSNESEKAMNGFKQVIKEAAVSQWAVGAKYYLGQAALEAKDKKEALSYWREYINKGHDGRFALDIINGMKDNFADELVPKDHANFAEIYYLNGRLSSAAAEWKAAGGDEDWYKLGICLIKTNRRREGEEILLAGMKAHKSDKDVPEAAKLMARVGTREEAISVWKTVLENCPDFGDYALFNLGMRASDEDALEYYSQLIQKYPNSEFAPETSWWLVWDKIKGGQLSAALKELREDAVKFETARSGSRFSFWTGKLEEKLNHKDAARQAYQSTVTKFGNHYYGWRAKGRLEALDGKSDRGWQTNTSTHLNEYTRILKDGNWKCPEPPHLVSYEKIASEGGALLACLAELHQWDECLEQTPKDQLHELRSICLAKQDQMMESINALAKDLHGTPDKDPRWKLSYPLLHANTIKAEASVKQVDPFLAQGLIREESRYNVMAVSSSNALGLMQLLPSTAMGVAKRLKVNVKSHADIHKPENNLKFGIDYISYTLSRHKGNAMLAVASYNGGPNAVAGWAKKYPMEDPDLFVEYIPYTETRDYVRKVFGSYWNYVAVYTADKL